MPLILHGSMGKKQIETRDLATLSDH